MKCNVVYIILTSKYPSTEYTVWANSSARWSERLGKGGGGGGGGGLPEMRLTIIYWKYIRQFIIMSKLLQCLHNLCWRVQVNHWLTKKKMLENKKVVTNGVKRGGGATWRLIKKPKEFWETCLTDGAISYCQELLIIENWGVGVHLTGSAPGLGTRWPNTIVRASRGILLAYTCVFCRRRRVRR